MFTFLANRCYSTKQWNDNFDICFDITGDAPLYYLFRVNGRPINCPFNGTFSFSYSKGLNECNEPLSRIEDCVDEQHLLLRYNACADIKGSERRGKTLFFGKQFLMNIFKMSNWNVLLNGKKDNSSISLVSSSTITRAHMSINFDVS